MQQADGVENQQPAKRKPPAAKPAGEPVLSKSRLNELAQKQKLPVPTYTSQPAPGGFISTVFFNGTSFKSLHPCPKRKDAEQNAAQVALHATVGAPLPPPPCSIEPTSKVTADGESEKQELIMPTISLKNLLQVGFTQVFF